MRVFLGFERKSNRSLMFLQFSKNWRKNLKITFKLVRIFKNIYDASKAPDHLPLNKISLTFWYRSQAISQNVFDFPRLAPQQRGFSGLLPKCRKRMCP